MAWDPPLKHPFSWMKPSSLFLSCSRAAVAQLIEVRNSLLYGSGGLGVSRNHVFSTQVTQEGQKAGNLRWLQGLRAPSGDICCFLQAQPIKKVLLKCQQLMMITAGT